MSTENVMKSKRFVVRKSLIGKNQVITFTNKKGDNITYNHDKVYEIMKSTLESINTDLNVIIVKFKKWKKITNLVLH